MELDPIVVCAVHDGNVIRQTYEREPADTRVIVADGFGIQVKTDHGQLVIADGIGPIRRERVIPRVGSPVQRLVIISPNGYVTLGALQWCADNHIQVIQLTRNGDLVISGQQTRSSDVTLMRAQVTASDERTLAIVKMLLTRKLEGQAKNLYDLLGTSEAANRTEAELAKMTAATTIEACRQSEARAAASYFGSWRNRVEPRFDKASVRKIPEHWRAFNVRGSVLSVDSKRHAVNPVNALLNYAYSIAYAEARVACIGAGLNPMLGYLHADSETRDSLALDILETIRPEIDRWIIQLIATRTFSASDFIESSGRDNVPAGTCRIVAPLTHEICEAAIQWQAPLTEAAETVRAIILGTAKAKRVIKQRTDTARPTDMQLVRSLIPDQIWDAVRPLLPVREGTVGKHPVDDRVILAMLVYQQRNNIARDAMPARFAVNERTARLRRTQWQQTGHWPAIASAAGLTR